MTIFLGIYVSKKNDPKLSKESVTKIQCEVEVISILYGYSRNCRQWRRSKKRYQLQRNMSVAYGIASERRYGIYRVVRFYFKFVAYSGKLSETSQLDNYHRRIRASSSYCEQVSLFLSLSPPSPTPSSSLSRSLRLSYFFLFPVIFNRHRRRRR